MAGLGHHDPEYGPLSQCTAAASFSLPILFLESPTEGDGISCPRRIRLPGQSPPGALEFFALPAFAN